MAELFATGGVDVAVLPASHEPAGTFITVGIVVIDVMPDTKSGRERNGRNKRSQLRRKLYDAERDALDDDESLPALEPSQDRPFLADELPGKK